MAFLAMALWAPVWLQAQVTPPVPQPAEVAQELKLLERKWGAALVSGDAKILGEILDDTYMDTDESGNQRDKSSVLASAKAGDLKLTSLQLSGMKIHSFVYAAVVTGRQTQSGTFKGQKLPHVVVFTDTFAIIDGKWKVVASHRSAVPSD